MRATQCPPRQGQDLPAYRRYWVARNRGPRRSAFSFPQVPGPELPRARPGEFCGLALMRIGPLLVHETVLGIIPVDLGRLAGALQRRLEIVYGLRRAPVVVVREMRLQRHADVARLGDIR